jgi:hypothetical protein
MTDITSTTEPRSDQLNADSFIGGKTMTIKVTKIDLRAGDQPVAVHYENENGRPYTPCKSMRRVLVHCWGPDGNAYAGRSMTLYCDEKVQFGGMAVGGIRISHMSHIDAPITMALTTTRASRKPFTVKPLVVQDSAPARITRDQQKEIVAAMGQVVKPADFLAHFGVKSSAELLAAKFSEAMEWIETQKGAPAGNPTDTATCPVCDTILRADGTCAECYPE